MAKDRLAFSINHEVNTSFWGAFINLLCDRFASACGVHQIMVSSLILIFFFPVTGYSALPGNTGAAEKEETPAQLSVGVAKMDITPDTAVLDWVTGRPYGEVHDPIFVRALVLGDGESKVVIVSWDLVDAGESATEEVRNGISSELGIPANQILVNATHNHSAPWSPVYNEDYRGKEQDTWWAIRHMPPQNDQPEYRKWMNHLIDQTVEAARQAESSSQSATLWIGRADVSEYLLNRRPTHPEWGIEESNAPEGFNYFHEEWDPNVLLGGAKFGPMDRAMTLLSFRDKAGVNIASVFHLSAHAVSIYPFMEGISSDWPGVAAKRISESLGGEAIFLQGAAGDITPWKRGREAVEEMGAGLAEKARVVDQYSARLEPGTLKAASGIVGLPLDPTGKERTGLDAVNAEVQVITYGSLALVTLPGEPLTDLGTAIRKQSPFPQTLVLGYSNGNGVHYVGMPGEKARGGYEMEAGTVGTDEAGQKLVELAVELLNEISEAD
ncbi:MAG: neutral/alkaline non-lysosomal ceramidase N-terminal domain-containing protein [Balneolales bacterium]